MSFRETFRHGRKRHGEHGTKENREEVNGEEPVPLKNRVNGGEKRRERGDAGNNGDGGKDGEKGFFHVVMG